VAEKRVFRAIKGTRDILPPDSALWNWFEQAARDVFETYGFRDIRTPIFEETSLFARSIGEETDVVSKEMYTTGFRELEVRREKVLTAQPDHANPSDLSAFSNLIDALIESAECAIECEPTYKTPKNQERLDMLRLKKIVFNSQIVPAGMGIAQFKEALIQVRLTSEALEFGDALTLRPEGTASVVRAYIEHGPHNFPGNAKLYYMGPMFRRERPQKGRYRQFYQIGAEVLGQSDAPGIDAEVIEMLLVFFKRVRLKNIKLQVNSIGHNADDCRRRYVEILRERLREIVKADPNALGADSQRRIETNPLRVLDSKVPHEQPIIETLPRISDHLCAACREHFAALKVELKLRGVEYEENWRLVRGLDYYTRTTFEVTASGLGSQNAVCGGGRYDGLVELLGGPPTKGIGFAIGSDRAILSIQEAGDLPDLPGLAVFVAWMGPKAYVPAIQITRKLREAGLAVELPADEMKFKKSLGLADKLGAKYALILGEDEVASGTFTLKRLKDADQKKMNENDLLEYLESERRG
jgi:histidyl-tRNA synthetase